MMSDFGSSGGDIGGGDGGGNGGGGDSHIGYIPASISLSRSGASRPKKVNPRRQRLNDFLLPGVALLVVVGAVVAAIVFT